MEKVIDSLLSEFEGTSEEITSEVDTSEVIQEPKRAELVPESESSSEVSASDIVKMPDGEPDLVPILEDAVIVPSQDTKNDEISLTIKEDDLPDVVLKAVLLGLAEEQHSLRSLRVKKELESKDTSHISIKRGTLLKYMSETLIQKQALTGGGGSLDLKGPKFREVFKMFLGVVSDTFEEMKLAPEYKDMFFNALSHNLDGWEYKAEKIIKAMTPK